MSVSIILMVAAFVLFVLATVGVPSPPRFQMIAGGLACWVLAVILGGIRL